MRTTANTCSLTRGAHEHLVLTHGTCCDQGTRQHCVCRISISCPVHGSICVGTHD